MDRPIKDAEHARHQSANDEMVLTVVVIWIKVAGRASVEIISPDPSLAFPRTLIPSAVGKNSRRVPRVESEVSQWTAAPPTSSGLGKQGFIAGKSLCPINGLSCYFPFVSTKTKLSEMSSTFVGAWPISRTVTITLVGYREGRGYPSRCSAMNPTGQI